MTFFKFYILVISLRFTISMLFTRTGKNKGDFKLKEAILECIADFIALLIVSYLVYHGFKYSGQEMINIIKNIF